MSIAEAVLDGTRILRNAGVTEPRLAASSLVAHAVGQDRTFIITHAGDELTNDARTTFRSSIQRRAAGEPIQYIIGHQEFFELDFEVSPAALIPRPETEILVELAIELSSKGTDIQFCDLGTGTGCIAISLLHNLPGARGTGLDISPEALQLAERNATRHGVTDRLRLITSDRFGSVEQQHLFDIVVSNPPYIPETELAELPRAVQDYEPRSALFAGPDGLDIIRGLLVETPEYLRPQGKLIFEIGHQQLPAVKALIEPSIWRLIETRNDLQGIPRAVALQANK